MKNTPKIQGPKDDQLTFKCSGCESCFDTVPGRWVDEPARAHPYRYFADCPECGEEVQQVAWQVGILCANARATGPRTPEGKAIAAKNLDGHPTPQEATITRFNALKHGASAKTAVYFPARPGKYPQCETCDIDHDYCRQQPACLKRTELLMKHLVAFQQQDPDLLMENHAFMQANLSALVEDMLLNIVQKGVAIESPAFGFSKDGFQLAEYKDRKTGEMVIINDLKAHPLLKPLFELLGKNNLSLADLNMTPKIKADQEESMGRLVQDQESAEKLEDYQNRQTRALERMSGLIAKSRERLKDDPVLLEHGAEEAAEDG